jgi:hypothetical protein
MFVAISRGPQLEIPKDKSQNPTAWVVYYFEFDFYLEFGI